MKMDCVYLGDEEQKKQADDSIAVCHLYEQCSPTGKESSLPSCIDCKDRLTQDDPKFADKWIDPLHVLDSRRLRTTSLRDLLKGASVFLAAGGPSANDLPLEQLNRRGVWTCCVNNMAGHARFRPQAFFCSDPPSKFSHSIWLDPAIMKFVPIPKMRGGRSKLKKKVGPRQFEPLGRRVCECPNVWGFKRNSWLTPDDQFFLSDGACWGNHQAGVERTGQAKTVCTFLLGLRLLRYLGAKRIYLIGVDFRMASDYGYAFDQGIGHKRPKDGSAPQYDNKQYGVVNDWLCTMRQNGVFGRFGLEIFNCNPTSSLRAFDHVPFEQAIIDVQGVVETAPDLSQWYEKM